MDAPPRRSLMDKWKDHWETRDQAFKVSPERASTVGVIFFWAYSASLLYTAVWIMIPQLSRYESNKQFWMKGFAWFVYIQTVINWLLTARKKISQVNDRSVPQGNEKLVTSLPEGWKSCPTCQLDVPPRSYHCKICKMCVLKRDHHCFFIGSCVGFYNQRYFIVFSFYATVSLFYGISLIIKYLSDPLPFFSRHGFTYLPPIAIWKWLFSDLNSGHFFFLVQLYAGLLVLLGSLWFLVWEMVMVYRGQTSFEATHGIQRYRVQPSVHFKTVFGPLWILNFFFPLPTQQEGNGVDWTTSKGNKGR